MNFRILRNEDGQFKVQRKVWRLFWADIGRYMFDGLSTFYNPQVVDSREEAEQIVEECERELRQRKWKVTGGKVLPPRPWPAPPERSA